MASSSQSSFVARLSRAEQFFQHINSFSDYAPGIPDLTTSAFRDLITQLTIIQTEHASTHHDFAEVAKKRKQLFTSNPDSIQNNMTLVKAYLKASKGVNSQQFIDVNTLIKKIKGTTPTIKITVNSTERTISTSEKSYGSQLQNFVLINHLIELYGTDYQPSNTIIKLENLKTQCSVANTVNNEVTIKYGAFKPKIAQRHNGFKKLLEVTMRIKEVIKSQYGVDSPEYNLIKVLRFN